MKSTTREFDLLYGLYSNFVLDMIVFCLITKVYLISLIREQNFLLNRSLPIESKLKILGKSVI